MNTPETPAGEGSSPQPIPILTRPTYITLLGGFWLLYAALYGLQAGLWAFFRPGSVSRSMPIAIIGAYVGIGLLKRNNRARQTAIVVSVIGIAYALRGFLYTAVSPLPRTFEVPQLPLMPFRFLLLITYVFTLWYLERPQSLLVFGKPGKPLSPIKLLALSVGIMLLLVVLETAAFFGGLQRL